MIDLMGSVVHFLISNLFIKVYIIIKDKKKLFGYLGNKLCKNYYGIGFK